MCRFTNESAAGNPTLPTDWGNLSHLEGLLLSGFVGTLPSEWGNESAFPQLEVLALVGNFFSGGLSPEWGRAGAFPELKYLIVTSSNLTGSLPAQWGVHRDLNITLLKEQAPATLVALPFRSIKFLDLSDNDFTGGLPLEWTNNPHFLEGTIVLDTTLFKASQDLPDFAKGVCTDPYRYEHYRNWSVALQKTADCDPRTHIAFTLLHSNCFISVSKAGLDPCSLDHTTKVVLIAVWCSSGLVAMLVCLVSLVRRPYKLVGGAVDQPDQHSKRFQGLKNRAKLWLENRLSPQHRILLGMIATVFTYWADIASDVPVLVESWEKKGIYFFTLLALMLGSHILDAILIARYALTRAEEEQGGNEASGTLFSRVLQKALWFLTYFVIAILALPALDVLCLASGPSSKMPADAIFKVDLEGYQTMRLVIGAVFRTIPTAIALTVIATLGNNPNNGTYFTPSVVGVSLGLSALQIIILTLQIRQKAAAAKEKTKLQLLRSVFSLKGLEPKDQSQTLGHDTVEPNDVGPAAALQNDHEKCVPCGTEACH